jgi:hypothetical protein
MSELRPLGEVSSQPQAGVRRDRLIEASGGRHVGDADPKVVDDSVPAEQVVVARLGASCSIPRVCRVVR